MVAAQKSFSVRETARLSGLSVTMVDYLCRTKIAIPTSNAHRGRGLPRRYQFGDVVVMRVISKFLAAGLSVSKLRKALEGLRKRHSEITASSLPAVLLITDGRTVFFRDRAEYVEDLSRGQLAFAFVLELSVIQREVNSKLPSGVRQSIVSPNVAKRRVSN